MKPSRAFWGTLFVAFGLLLLLGRIFDWGFDCDYIWKFWPMAFVLVGLAIVFKQPIVKLVLSGLAAVVVAVFLYTLVSFNWLPWHREILLEDDESEPVQVQDFTEAFAPGIRSASFRMDMAAGKFRVDTATKDLFHANVRSGVARFDLVRGGSSEDVSLHLDQREEIHVRNWRSHHAMSVVQVNLHPAPVWDLTFDIGAASVDMDLSALKVRDLDIEGGASHVRLMLGLTAPRTNVRCEMGASAIRISVPETVGCEIHFDSDLSSKRLDDFTEFDDNTYRTDNFDAAQKKIFIEAKTGLASIRIVRY